MGALSRGLRGQIRRRIIVPVERLTLSSHIARSGEEKLGWAFGIAWQSRDRFTTTDSPGGPAGFIQGGLKCQVNTRRHGIRPWRCPAPNSQALPTLAHRWVNAVVQMASGGRPTHLQRIEDGKPKGKWCSPGTSVITHSIGIACPIASGVAA
ncbi:hypothetical protein R1flu_022521 [Riccia fluitans]|uniref:Uncharacterized protein n=1 Tax=Riccia fluitans TaxID=41844 RepID=A0ABD1XPY2_9MARC